MVALQAVEDGLKATTHQFDINKSLGLTREKLQYDKRLKALTKPEEYAGDRTTKWNEMAGAVSTYYQDTVKYLQDAGFDWEECKDKAKDLSKQFAAIERQKLELQFPTAANVIGAQRQVDLAFNAGGGGAFNPAELAAASQPGPIQPAARKKSSSRKKK